MMDHLIFKPKYAWHKSACRDSIDDSSADIVTCTDIAKLYTIANNLLEEDTQNYENEFLKAHKLESYFESLFATGTFSDKISALCLVIQKSPVHNRKCIQVLISLGKCKNRSHGLFALTTFVDLISQGIILPEKAKLRYFNSQPGLINCLVANNKRNVEFLKPAGHKYQKYRISRSSLIAWAFEDWLKREYLEFINILESRCNDTIIHSRLQALKIVYTVLLNSSEQEDNLLRLLIRKLSDSSHKVWAYASHSILQLTRAYTSFKVPVISLVEEELLLNPHTLPRTQSVGILVLNQIGYHENDIEVGEKLGYVYASFTLKLIKVYSRNSSMALSGDARAMRKKCIKERGLNGKSTCQTENGSIKRLFHLTLSGFHRILRVAQIREDLLNSLKLDLKDALCRTQVDIRIRILSILYRISPSEDILSQMVQLLVSSISQPYLSPSSKALSQFNLLQGLLWSNKGYGSVWNNDLRRLETAQLYQEACLAYKISRLLKDFHDGNCSSTGRYWQSAILSKHYAPQIQENYNRESQTNQFSELNRLNESQMDAKYEFSYTRFVHDEKFKLEFPKTEDMAKATRNKQEMEWKESKQDYFTTEMENGGLEWDDENQAEEEERFLEINHELKKRRKKAKLWNTHH